jgi:hypothetical protein
LAGRIPSNFASCGKRLTQNNQRPLQRLICSHEVNRLSNTFLLAIGSRKVSRDQIALSESQKLSLAVEHNAGMNRM